MEGPLSYGVVVEGGKPFVLQGACPSREERLKKKVRFHLFCMLWMVVHVIVGKNK